MEVAYLCATMHAGGSERLVRELVSRYALMHDLHIATMLRAVVYAHVKGS